MEPVVIYLGPRSDGCVYELSTASQERLRKTPGARPVNRVFISYDTLADYEKEHGSFDQQAVQLLTGLSAERLRDLGGVELYDPRTEKMTPLDPSPSA